MRCATLVMVLASCGRSQPETRKAEHAPACSQQAAELATWAKQVVTESATRLPIDREIRLADAPGVDPTPLQTAPLVTIRKNSLVLDSDRGTHEVAAPNLVRELQAYDARRAGDHSAWADCDNCVAQNGADIPPVRDHRVSFAIDVEAPMDRIAPVADALARAGFTDATFIFQRPTALKPPAPSSVSQQLASVTDAAGLAALLERVIAPCPALDKLFHDAGEQREEPIDGYVAARLEPALQACSCSLDLAALRTMLWSVLGHDGPSVTWTAAKLATKHDGETSVITGATWGAAAPRVIDARGRHIVLTGP